MCKREETARILYSIACLPDATRASYRNLFVKRYSHHFNEEVSKQVFNLATGQTEVSKVSVEAAKCWQSVVDVVAKVRGRSSF